MAQVKPLFSFCEDFRGQISGSVALFRAGLSATQAARMAGVSVRSVNPIFLRLRRRLAQECELPLSFQGNLEADESYFGPRRVRRQARARSRFKDHRLRSTETRRQSLYGDRPHVAKPTLRAAIRGHADLESVIHTDGWSGYDVLGSTSATHATIASITARTNSRSGRTISTELKAFGDMPSIA